MQDTTDQRPPCRIPSCKLCAPENPPADFDPDRCLMDDGTHGLAQFGEVLCAPCLHAKAEQAGHEVTEVWDVWCECGRTYLVRGGRMYLVRGGRYAGARAEIDPATPDQRGRLTS